MRVEVSFNRKRAASILIGLALILAWADTSAAADTTPPPQAPPVLVKITPPQPPLPIAAEVRVVEPRVPQAPQAPAQAPAPAPTTRPYGPTDPANTELTLQGAVTEAKRRWGSGGTAWADPRDLAGVIWLHVGTFDTAVGKYWIYGRGLRWEQAFRDAELNGWPEAKRGAGLPQAPQAPVAPTPTVALPYAAAYWRALELGQPLIVWVGGDFCPT